MSKLTDLFKNIDKEALWKTTKLFLRLAVFTVVGVLVDAFIQYFSGLNTEMGVAVSSVLVIVDKYIHEAKSNASTQALEGFERGLLPF